jgi:hypothetical protein
MVFALIGVHGPLVQNPAFDPESPHNLLEGRVNDD